MVDTEKAASQPVAVYTAIPVQQNDSSSLESQVFTSEADHHDEPPSEADENVSLDETIRSCKYYGIGLGFVIGCFIQLASMGAFFLYRAISGSTETTTENSNWNQTIFSLVWSVITSTLGVLIVVQLTAMINRVQKLRGGSADEVLLLHLECSIILGVVLGLTSSCAAKNFWLAGSRGLGSSIVMLGMTLFYYAFQLIMICVLIFLGRVITKYFQHQHQDRGQRQQHEPLDELELGDDEATVNSELSSMSLPLLLTSDGQEQDHNDNESSYRASSMVFGLVVGCFIQLSCLGANYCLLFLWNDDDKQQDVNKNDSEDTFTYPFMFNMAWDLFTSGLGLSVLFFIRKLLLIKWTTTTTESSLSSTTLLNVEAFFAVGTLIGVNLSWLLTNYLMGFSSNVIHSSIMLAVSLIWCGLIVTSTREESSASRDEDNNEDYKA